MKTNDDDGDDDNGDDGDTDDEQIYTFMDDKCIDSN